MALAATSTNDGILSIPTASGIAAFSIASVNVGFDDVITVRADTGGATLPLQLLLCETDPVTAACINPTQPGTDPVTTTIPANATPTFSVFAVASGDIALDPALNRIFVRFVDSSGPPAV